MLALTAFALRGGVIWLASMALLLGLICFVDWRQQNGQRFKAPMLWGLGVVFTKVIYKVASLFTFGSLLFLSVVALGGPVDIEELPGVFLFPVCAIAGLFLGVFFFEKAVLLSRHFTGLPKA